MDIVKKDDFDWRDNDIEIQTRRHSTTGMHFHEFIELAYIVDGEIEHTAGGQTLKIKKGDVLLFDIGTPHGFKSDNNEEIKITNVTFSPEFLLSIVDDSFIELVQSLFLGGSVGFHDGYLCLTDADTTEIGLLIEQMLEEQASRRPGYLKIIRSLLTTVIIKIFRLIPKPTSSETVQLEQRLVNDIIEYTDNHAVKDLSVKNISKELFFSPSYLGRLFSRQTGQSLSKFIQDKKLFAAKELLLSTEKPIEEIMYSVGYSDKTHFYDVFLQKYGMKPGEYRKKTT